MWFWLFKFVAFLLFVLLTLLFFARGAKPERWLNFALDYFAVYAVLGYVLFRNIPLHEDIANAIRVWVRQWLLSGGC